VAQLAGLTSSRGPGRPDCLRSIYGPRRSAEFPRNIAGGAGIGALGRARFNALYGNRVARDAAAQDELARKHRAGGEALFLFGCTVLIESGRAEALSAAHRRGRGGPVVRQGPDRGRRQRRFLCDLYHACQSTGDDLDAVYRRYLDVAARADRRRARTRRAGSAGSDLDRTLWPPWPTASTSAGYAWITSHRDDRRQPGVAAPALRSVRPMRRSPRSDRREHR